MSDTLGSAGYSLKLTLNGGGFAAQPLTVGGAYLGGG